VSFKGAIVTENLATFFAAYGLQSQFLKVLLALVNFESVTGIELITEFTSK